MAYCRVFCDEKKHSILKIFANLAYDGSYFAGFSRQKSAKNTVVNELEAALKSLQINTSVIGAGRTDKGVHARGQAISFEIPNFWSDFKKLSTELNNKLHPKMHIYNLKESKDEFEVRFNAKSRSYVYLIRQKKYSPFFAKYTWQIDCDLKKAQNAIKLFEGTHDFANFCKTDNTRNNTTIRTMFKTKAFKYSDGIGFYFKANGFLRSQVRLMSAFIVAISCGKLSAEELTLQLECKEKFLTKPAPPEGLYLNKVEYDFF